MLTYRETNYHDTIQLFRDAGTFATHKDFVYAGNGQDSCIMAWQCDDRDEVVDLDIVLRQLGIA